MRVEWLVVFEDASHFAMPILKQGFGHCWAARPQGDGWIVVNPSFSHTQVAVVTDEGLVDMLGKNSYLWARAEPSGYRFPGVFTCVDAVKSLLGIGRPILTPYQLYRYLSNGEGSQEIA